MFGIEKQLNRAITIVGLSVCLTVRPPILLLKSWSSYLYRYTQKTLGMALLPPTYFYLLKASEYRFKQNKNMLKNMIVLLSTYFYISLNVLGSTFLNIYNLPFLRSPNIGKIRVKVGPKTNCFSYILSSCTNRIAVFNNFFFTDM